MRLQTNTLAKLQSPVADDAVFRKRLFLALEQARKKRAIWITGLPGSGKTTLVASYISAYKIPHAWYHIDSSDTDIATFFYYLKLLVKGINGKKSTRLPVLTPEYLPNISIFAQRYFENLYSMLPKGFVLVFDNYHEVNANPLFHTIMHEALMNVPEHGNIILISRTEPPDSFSTFETDSMMEIVGNELIKFTSDETQELIKLRSGNGHNKEMVNRLHDFTDGWAAGIILMLERNKEKLEIASQEDFKDNQAIFDYFSAEIFEKMKPADQDFLVKTCLFPTMTVEMATQMSGSRTSKKLLGDLIKSHYFTIKYQDNTYKYHDLFREFLLVRAKMYFSATELQRINKQSAMILKENGKIEDAVKLFRKAGSIKDIQKIILEQAQALIEQGRNKVLEEWIKAIPEDILNQEPWLLYWLGEARAVFNPVEGRLYFERAFRLFFNAGHNSRDVYSRRKVLPAGLYLSWCGIIETFIYEYGNFELINKWVMEMEKIIRTYHTFPSRDLEERILSLLVFALTHYNPYHTKIELWADRVLQLLKYSKDPNQSVYYSFSILHYFAWIGDVSKYQVLVELMQKIPQSLSIKSQLLQKMYGAGYARQIVSKEECLRFVSEGMEMAHQYGVRFLDHMIISQAVYLLFSINDLNGVENFLQKMGLSVNHSNALQISQYAILSGWLDHLRGNISLAIEKIERSLVLSIKAQIPFAQAVSRFALAQILYEQGDYKKAGEHFKHGLFIAKGMKSKSLELTSYYIQAYWLLNEKHSNTRKTENKGLRILKKCLVMSKKYGLVNVYFAWGQKMAYLSLKALENNIEVHYVRDLIHKLELFPDTPPYACESWPWAFKIYTLGSFKILNEDAPVELSKKAQLKPVELLQFLIVNHDKAVELDHISGMLWPDAQGDYAHQTLDTTIHRLRKLLGSNDAVIAEGGRLMLNPKICWVDVQAFDSLFDSMDGLLEKKNWIAHQVRNDGKKQVNRQDEEDDQVKELGRRILNLYKGDFFAQGTLPSWAISFRDSLHDRFTHVIEMLGDYYEKSGDTVQAVRIYKKGLEIDNQAELFYQRLMLLYQSHGRTAEAAALYKHCEVILSRTLGIKPSDKTRKIYQNIIKSKR